MAKNLTTLLLLFVTNIASAQTSTLNRPNDPVVLTGDQLTTFSALQPNQIVGFKFVNGTWAQIPIQVDERALLDIVTPYGALAAQASYPPSPSNPKITFYCDAGTNTGADATTTFDSDDELVFMAKDAGGQSNGATPNGVVANTCREITITDPLGGVGYVYLFQNGGSLQQGAGVSYVTYTSNLSSTAGFPANLNTPNTENTVITTSKYSWKFSAEWVSDEYKLIVGNNTDILDRYKNFFANGNCVRHEDAFSAAENAYVTAKAGPIRAIRSYMGAVSGPLTQRTHIFYQGRQDMVTDLRVHSIVSIYDAFDYNSNANGMIYRNNLNTTGVTINGQQDVVTAGDIQWEQVSGTPGTISILHRRTTTLVSPTEANFTSYYDDNSVNPASNCTGDGQAWGTSGVGIVFASSNVCTDPMGNGCQGSQWLRSFQARRTIYSDAPNGASTAASTYNNQFNNPLTVAIGACQVQTTYTVTTSSNPVAGGTTTGGGTYSSGASVTITATANGGYTFTNWTENGNLVSSNASYTFTISANRNLVANFTQTTTNYTVTTSSNPVGGGTTTGGGTYASEASVTVTATANGSYTFTNWTENGNQVSTNASYTFTISANRTLVANFVASPNSVTRNNDPVVVKGNNLPCMIGVQPSLIVAYKFNGTNLVQIPMQVDEVVVKEASAPYNNLGCAFGTVNNNNTYDNISFYADANTFTGPDTNVLFDLDDELVFMAKDAGSKLNICPPTPSGVINNTTCELELRDPINNALLGYVYLFQQNGTLNQGAGVNYVTYNFTYANNYQQAYDICTGGVTENSTITTVNYSMKYTKRVIEEELKITAGGATNIDILDAHQFFVAPNNCFRSEETFSNSRGTVVTSKNGPVRAIRSVMGANSGVGTQWTIKFTESRIDYQMDFRVHPIGGFFDVLDLNPNAVGMMYYNSQNPNGVQVDGVQDVLVTTNPNTWELYTGNQGSIAIGYDYQTDIPLGPNSFVEAYFDDGGTTNQLHTCTGDGFAYGASGFHLATPLCTDYWATSQGCGALASYFRLNRRNYLLPPGITTAQAATYANYGINPITTTNMIASLTSFCNLGYDSNSENLGFNIYPNPSTGKVFISSLFVGELRIVNYLGQLIKTINLKSNLNEVEINTDGVYLFHFTDSDHKTFIKRIIIRK